MSMDKGGLRRYLLTTNPGIEDIVAAEVKERIGARATYPFWGLEGRILVETEAEGQRELLKLRSVYYVMREVGSFPVGTGSGGLNDIYRGVRDLHIPEVEGARTFRVTSTRIGTHEYTSIDVQKAAGQAIVERYGKKVDLKGYEVEVIVDVIGRRCWVGVNMTRDSLHKRFERPFDHMAAIKPPLAYAMLRMARIEPGMALLDPMCGGGTIPIEAAQVYGPRIRIYGSDISPKALRGAIENAEAAGVSDLIEFKLLDARRIDREFAKVDRIVTNPPYGVRMGDWEGLKPLYSAFLDAAHRVLKEEGLLVIITLRAVSFRDMIQKKRSFSIAHERVVEAGGLHPHIFVLQKL